MRGEDPVFLSMLCHRDVVAYLVAIKSIYRAVGQGRVMIVDDGSLTDDDFVLLGHHVPGIETVAMATISTGGCPRGGTWERLVKIVSLSANNYVIQIDADTLARGDLPEVVASWRQNRSFLLGTDVGQDVRPVSYTAGLAKGWIGARDWDAVHVGTVAESVLDRIPDADGKYYVHASSGFAGFAKGGFEISDLEAFSRDMSEIIGKDRWNKWGTEQISSNYILSNAGGAVVLPFPEYACFEPHLGYRDGRHRFLHFIGTYRYDMGVYRKLAKDFISEYGGNGARRRP